MAANWEWYVRRVGLDVEKWLVRREIRNYESFCRSIKKREHHTTA